MNTAYLRAKGNIPDWLIAESLGISEEHFKALLEKEMDDTTRGLAIAAVAEIKAEFRRYRVAEIFKDSRPSAV